MSFPTQAMAAGGMAERSSAALRPVAVARPEAQTSSMVRGSSRRIDPALAVRVEAGVEGDGGKGDGRLTAGRFPCQSSRLFGWFLPPGRSYIQPPAGRP